MHTWLNVLPLALAAVHGEDPITTDRPDFTESAIVVPRGRFQIESGATFERTEGTHSAAYPELLMRYGQARDWELRLGAPNYFTSRADGDRSEGWGDLYVGAKRQFGPCRNGLDFAVIVATFLPTGDSGFGAKEAEPEIKLCAAKDLTDRTSLSGMIYVAWPAKGPEAWQGTLSFGTALDGGLSAFFEYAGSFRRDERPEHLWHAGLVFRRTSDEQWDIHLGFAPGPERRQFLAFGYSVRK